MRALVATTCIAVLAVVGYLAWNEFGMAERLNASDPAVSAAKQRITESAASFAPGQYGTDEAELKRYCDYRWASMPSYNHDATGIRADCRTAGYIK